MMIPFDLDAVIEELRNDKGRAGDFVPPLVKEFFFWYQVNAYHLPFNTGRKINSRRMIEVIEWLKEKVAEGVHECPADGIRGLKHG